MTAEKPALIERRHSSVCNSAANFATPLQKISTSRQTLQRHGKLCNAVAKDFDVPTTLQRHGKLCNAVAKDFETRRASRTSYVPREIGVSPTALFILRW